MDKEIKIFRALADPLRLKLAILLSNGDEICVCKLTEALNEPQFKISRHLGILRTAGLVEARRQGTWMHYRLTKTGTALDDVLVTYFKKMRPAVSRRKGSMTLGCRPPQPAKRKGD